jgi:hypothetical protein
MFNPQAASSGVSSRSLVFRHALAAAFKARRQNLPAPPAALPMLLQALQQGMSDALSRPGTRAALNEIRTLLFKAPGREADAQSCWHESVTAAMFAARVAQLRPASIAAAGCGGLLHRVGEALALKMLARVELEYRMKLDGPSRREWCTAHDLELAERLVRCWNLPPEVGTCVLGWQRIGEFAAVSPESGAVYLGRLCAIQMLHPQLCVPGALEQAAIEFGLGADGLSRLQAEFPRARELLRLLD